MPPPAFSETEAEAAWANLRHEVLPWMKVAEPGWAEDPEVVYHRGDPDERAVLIQHLTDLGYVKFEAINSLDDAQLRLAVAAWRHDNASLPATDWRANTLVTCREFLYPGEMPRLAAQVGFERELRLIRLPAVGETSLLTRIIHFRLKSFDLLPPGTPEVSAPFTDSTLAKLTDVAAQLKIEPDQNSPVELQIANLLGDAAELSRRLMRYWGEWVFVFHHDPAELDHSVASELPSLAGSNARFRALCPGSRRVYERLFIACGRHRQTGPTATKGAHVQNMFGEDGFRYYSAKKPLNWIRDEIASRLPAEQAATHEINRLGLELLQLRLWMLGFYRGRVDGKWGPLSFAALEDFLADEKVDVSKLIFPLANHFIALNLRYLFNRILPKIEEPSGSVRVQDVNALGTETWRQIDQDDGWEGVAQSYQRMGTEDHRLYGQPNHPRKRYHGLLAILAAIGRFLKSVAHSVIKAARRVVRAIKKGLSMAMQLFRHFIRGLRRGLRVVGLAVKRFYYWLFCKPFVTGEDRQPSCVFTQFQHDGDAFHFACLGAEPRLLRQHRRQIQRMNLAFDIVGRLAVQAIGLLVEAATENWLKLSWTLARLVTSRFWRELKELIRRYRETWPLLEPRNRDADFHADAQAG